MDHSEKIAVLIIAAGASTRLGQPKQLLPFKKTTLLNYVIKECLDFQKEDVFLILGAHKDRIVDKLSPLLPIEIIYNENWAEGMGTSIAKAVQYLSNDQYDGVFIVLSDQPFFNQKILQKLATAYHRNQTSIVLSKYQTGLGPPAYFHASLFPALQSLTGDQGAKAIIQQFQDSIVTIDFPKGNIDIDQEKDLKYLEDAE